MPYNICEGGIDCKFLLRYWFFTRCSKDLCKFLWASWTWTSCEFCRSFSSRNKSTILSRGDFPKCSVYGTKPVLWCKTTFKQFSIIGTYLAQPVCLSAQKVRKNLPNSLMVRSTGFYCGCLIDEKITFTPSASKLVFHNGDVNCVPWSDSTQFGFPTLAK